MGAELLLALRERPVRALGDLRATGRLSHTADGGCVARGPLDAFDGVASRAKKGT